MLFLTAGWFGQTCVRAQGRCQPAKSLDYQGTDEEILWNGRWNSLDIHSYLPENPECAKKILNATIKAYETVLARTPALRDTMIRGTFKPKDLLRDMKGLLAELNGGGRTNNSEAAHEVEIYVQDIENLRSRVSKGEGFFTAREDIVQLLLDREAGKRAVADRIKQGINVTVTPEDFQPLDQALDDLQKEIERVAATNKGFSQDGGSVAGVPDAGFDQLTRASIKKKWSGANILKTVLFSRDWNVTKNSLGIPLYRDRYGAAIYKLGGQQRLRQSKIFPARRLQWRTLHEQPRARTGNALSAMPMKTVMTNVFHARPQCVLLHQALDNNEQHDRT